MPAPNSPGLLPGAEIGYDQITGNVTVSSATEGSGTTVITCAARFFDGDPVVVSFNCTAISVGTSDFVIVCLFEGGTEIGRFCQLGVTGFGGGQIRFTPSAGVHTYTVTAFRNVNNGTINAGAGGAGVYSPTFVRFAKA